MALLVEVFIIVGFFSNLLLLFRFKRNKYIFFLLLAALINPNYYTLFSEQTHIYSTAIPYLSVVLLTAFPGRELKYSVLLFFGFAILYPHLGTNALIPLLVVTLSLVFIIICLCEDLYVEINSNGQIPLFLPILILELSRNTIFLYLFYENQQLLKLISPLSMISGTIFLILMVYYGPERKVKYSFSKKEDEIEGNIGENSEMQNLQLLNFTGGVSTQGLTKMENKVLSLLANGCSNKEIAQTLFVSSRTVYFHINNLKEKLRIDKTSHLMKFAIENRELVLKANKPAQSTAKFKEKL